MSGDPAPVNGPREHGHPARPVRGLPMRARWACAIVTACVMARLVTAMVGPAGATALLLLVLTAVVADLVR